MSTNELQPFALTSLVAQKNKKKKKKRLDNEITEREIAFLLLKNARFLFCARVKDCAYFQQFSSAVIIQKWLCLPFLFLFYNNNSNNDSIPYFKVVRDNIYSVTIKQKKDWRKSVFATYFSRLRRIKTAIYTISEDYSSTLSNQKKKKKKKKL